VTIASPQRFTEAEYLALERASETKHEFVDGTIVAMAGATPAHNTLAANVTSALVVLARGRDCAVLTSDQRVHVPRTGLYAYPDATLVCGEQRYANDRPPSLLNPTLVVEVTSKSTEDYDRGTKFLHYQAIASLRTYLVVSHREKRIDRHQRLDTGEWLATAFTSHDARIEIPALAGTISLADVYDKVRLDDA
jgi:Uma2 family endonuclease